MSGEVDLCSPRRRRGGGDLFGLHLLLEPYACGWVLCLCLCGVVCLSACCFLLTVSHGGGGGLCTTGRVVVLRVAVTLLLCPFQLDRTRRAETDFNTHC